MANKLDRYIDINGVLYEIWPTAADLGLDSALKYHGVTTTTLSDGATTNPIVINGSNHTATAGCVVFSENKEFVFDGKNWKELGDGSNHKIKQDAVSSPSASGSTTAFIDTISQDANGKITVTKKNVQTATTSAAGLMSAGDKTLIDYWADNIYATDNEEIRIGGGDTYISVDTCMELHAMGRLDLVSENGEVCYHDEEIAVKSDIPTLDYNPTTKILTIS